VPIDNNASEREMKRGGVEQKEFFVRRQSAWRSHRGNSGSLTSTCRRHQLDPHCISPSLLNEPAADELSEMDAGCLTVETPQRREARL